MTELEDIPTDTELDEYIRCAEHGQDSPVNRARLIAVATELAWVRRQRDQAHAQLQSAVQVAAENVYRLADERDAALVTLDAVEQLRATWAAWSGGPHDEYAMWAERQLAVALAGHRAL